MRRGWGWEGKRWDKRGRWGRRRRRGRRSAILQLFHNAVRCVVRPLSGWMFRWGVGAFLDSVFRVQHRWPTFPFSRPLVRYAARRRGFTAVPVIHGKLSKKHKKQNKAETPKQAFRGKGGAVVLSVIIRYFRTKKTKGKVFHKCGRE